MTEESQAIAVSAATDSSGEFSADESLPLVSIVIPCYNYGGTLEETIDSCLASTFSEIEIIVVNDGSTDPETLEILHNLNKPKTTVIHQSNKRMAGARNTGIRAARGKYILPVDSDDKIHPTYIEKAFWVLETRPEVGFVSSWLKHFGDEDWIWRPAAFDFYHLLVENTVPIATLFRKEAWAQVGGFNELMVHGYEDWDFWIALAESGWQGFQIPEPLFFYRKHGKTTLHGARQRHAELLRQLRKNHPKAYRWRKWVQLSRSVSALRPAAPTVRVKHLMKAILRQMLPSPMHAPIKRTYGRAKQFVAVAKTEGPVFALKKAAKKVIKKTLPLSMRGPLAHRYRQFQARRATPVVLTAEVPQVATLHPRPADRYQVNISSSHKARLLFIFPWLEVGGADKVNLDLLQGLDLDRYEVTIATTMPSGHPWHERFEGYTQDIFHLANFVQKEHVADFLVNLIESRRIDLIQVSNSLDGFEALPAIKERFPDLPVISLVHNYVPAEPWDYARVSAQFAPQVSAYVAITDSLKHAMVHRLGLPAAKIRVIPNGVDETQYIPAPESRAAIRHRLEIPLERDVITFVGRLSAEKDPLKFLRIARYLIESDHQCNRLFLVVGDGPLLPELSREVAYYQLQDRIRLLGARENVDEILRATSVLVAPSRFEGLPIIGLEAMATGVPIVASRVVGWSDLITSEHDGVLVEPYDEIGFAKRIEALLSDRVLREQLGRHARKTIERRYTLTKFAGSYRFLFGQLIDRSEPEPIRNLLGSEISQPLTPPVYER